MPPDPELVAETRGWFLRASRDLAGGDVDLRAEPALTGDAVFHAQQAAEKSMKGFLTWHGRPFRKTHNLTELGGACVEMDPALEPLLRSASTLTEFAWRYRYPGEPEEPELMEAEAALSLARDVYGALLTPLPEEVRP